MARLTFLCVPRYHPFLIVETTVLCGIRILLRPFVARGDIFASLCGPQALFLPKMWPANIVEFKTPALKEPLGPLLPIRFQSSNQLEDTNKSIKNQILIF